MITYLKIVTYPIRLYLALWASVFYYVYKALRVATSAFWGWLSSFVGGAIRAVTNFIGGVLRGFQTMWNAVWRVIGAPVRAAFTAIMNVIGSTGNWIIGRIVSIGNKIIAVFKNAGSWLYNAGKNILIDGSSVLIHTLAQHDLIDEYHLLVYPVVLGGGKKVFPDGVRLDLRLAEAKPCPSGVVLTRYTVEHSA